MIITRRDVLIDALAGATAAGLFAGAASANSTSAPGNELPTGDVHDFDFFVGNWESTNRRLRKRWVGSNDWETFPCTIRCESRMNGVVNIDEGVFPTKGWSGMTLRVFNQKTHQWDAARWQQAFSLDGKEWETNWIIDHRRVKG
jgi:hypothetical protein